ncbi:MAG: hypothetical protein Q9187_001140 [Circinaria calcarea]
MESIPLLPITTAPLTTAVVLPIALTIAATYLYTVILAKPPSVNVPLVGLDLGGTEKRKSKYVSDANSLLKEGYEKFKNGLFQITTSEGPEVVASRQYIDELKNRPDSELSFSATADEFLASKYTGLNTKDDHAVHVIRADLTPKLGGLMPEIFDEVEHALSVELPTCEDWTPININSKLVRIVAQVSGRVFIGLDLCREEDWIATTIQYTLDVFAGAKAIRAWRPWLRPFVYRFLPELRRLDQLRKNAQRFMIPVFKARKEAQSKADYQPSDNFLQWLDDKAERFHADAKSLEYQANVQLSLSMAAIHTTTGTCTHALYDLAAHPEHIQPLREELRMVLSESGGVFASTTLSKLKKLDSFMKESFRLNPPGLVSFKRKVLSDITLSDGTYLPKGTSVELPSYPIQMDPSVIPDPEKFDGFRFYKKRQSSAEESHGNQFVTVSKESLNFGYGRHACPGRFFASMELKVILANILLRYDIALEDPEAGRYKNWAYETMVSWRERRSVCCG